MQGTTVRILVRVAVSMVWTLVQEAVVRVLVRVAMVQILVRVAVPMVEPLM